MRRDQRWPGTAFQAESPSDRARRVLIASLLIAVVLAVWWFDRYDREPLPLLLGVLFWGLVMAPALVGGAFAFDLLPRPVADGSWPGVVAVYSAAALEEAAKGYFLDALRTNRLFSRLIAPAAVRAMKPPCSPAESACRCRMSRSRTRSVSSSIFCDTPTLLTLGMNTM